MSHNSFVNIEVPGHIVNIDASNADETSGRDQFSYISCDPSAYTDETLDASDVFRIAVNQPRANIVILYSETSDHCTVQGLDSLPVINGILTTIEAMAATMLADLNLTSDSPGSVSILPDLNAYTNSSSNNGFSNDLDRSPTTAVAMIILYSITGVITALFVVIIVTGAVRAHRHPERYGPRTIIGGRGRQSRARGVARAMLDTLPIVKFGDRLDPAHNHPAKEGQDVEMNASRTDQSTTPNADAASTADDANAVPKNPDGTDAEGHLGCSICTEDFTKGEEVRVLPCNHKFHPDCVDPWLLNVSGTCPLCRIDLRPQDSAQAGEDGVTAEGEGGLAPPLAGGVGDRNASVSGGVAVNEQGHHAAQSHGLRRDTIANLRRLARSGGSSSEDRIAALRRYRQENRAMAAAARAAGDHTDEGERRGLTRRLRERFHIRTEGGDGRRGTGVE